jgi:hypothetical protein
MFVTIVESPKGALGIDKAVCFGKLNRKEVKYDGQYHKPDCLSQELMNLYHIGQNGRLYHIGQNGGCPWERMRAMRDPLDGGLMFCYSKRGSWPRNQFCELCNLDECCCNGMLPSVKTISEFVNTQTQKQQKKQKVQDSTELANEPAEALENVPKSS